ncbi:MAG: alkaline phosphatase family protein [Desulfurococcales archaeon]|nr:alkaline phosphatase family protein [Desulfurococcales archaeon]
MARLKLAYIVLDGAADGPAPKRALDEAETPHLDRLAATSLCFGVYTIAPGVAPESDAAVLSLLGYDPHKYYTGRGPLEAVGAGIPFRDGQVAFRANFATVDPRSMRIIDRRAGRSVTSVEARMLAEALDGMELAGGEARALFRATIGHRAVLVLSHRSSRLSASVSNSDPAYKRVGAISVALRDYEPYIAKVEPLDDTPEARLTAELANEFTRRAIEILDSHPVNEDRRRRGLLPANAVLLRDAGDRLPPVEPFRERFGLDMASIVEMVVERGIARVLGLHDIPVEVEGRSRRDILVEEAEKAAQALERFDGVYVHLKGPDEPGHDGDFEAKKEAIEDIDRHFFSRLLDLVDPTNILFIVTSDHATPWSLKAHSGDPVPLMFSNPRIGSGIQGFGETGCLASARKVLEGGYNILPEALSVMESLGR